MPFTLKTYILEVTALKGSFAEQKTYTLSRGPVRERANVGHCQEAGRVLACPCKTRAATTLPGRVGRKPLPA